MAQQEEPSAVGRLLLGMSQLGRVKKALLVSGAVAVIVGVAISWSAGSSVGRAVLIRRGEESARETAGISRDVSDGDEEVPSGSSGSDNLDSDDLLAAEAEDDAVVVIDVDGAVNKPGVYELPDGSRVADAIDAAGGLAGDADVARVNRAERLVDGAKLLIPRVGDQASDGATGGQISVGGASAGSAETGLVSINQASIDELDALPGIGPATAEKIVADREQNGPFLAIEDLMRVSGIGEKKFADLRDLICV